jgi:hypothetical protein
VALEFWPIRATGNSHTQIAQLRGRRGLPHLSSITPPYPPHRSRKAGRLPGLSAVPRSNTQWDTAERLLIQELSPSLERPAPLNFPKGLHVRYPVPTPVKPLGSGSSSVASKLTRDL